MRLNELKTPTKDYKVDMQPKLCEQIAVPKGGESHGLFYDRKGYFFRDGVDPRNHTGRFMQEDIDKHNG